MLLVPVPLVIHVLVNSVSAIAISPAETQTLQLPDTNQTFFEENPASNQSLMSLNATFKDDLEIRCYGTAYGYNPDIADCQNAINYVHPSRKEVTFADRQISPPSNVFRLPFRVMGDRALCFFQPILQVGAEFGTASFDDIRTAGQLLLNQCGKDQNQGGIATNIGRDNSLALIMGTYQPRIQCSGTIPYWSSCRYIFSDMPTSDTNEVFGSSRDPQTQVKTPYTLSSDDGKCHAKIISSSSDSSTWYKMWEAISALYAVCGRHIKGGKFAPLGDNGQLAVTLSSSLSDASTDPENSPTAATEVSTATSSGKIIATSLGNMDVEAA